MTNNLRYFIGNWKMFGDFNSFKIVKKIDKFYIKFKKEHKKIKIVLCVPNTLISFFKNKLNSKNILLGAQNCSQHEKEGPFTGSVSASMIKKAGAEYVILGHSENRIDGESPNLIKKKIKSALKENLNIIFCVGETSSERKRGKTFSVLKNQINKSLDRKFNLNKIIIAYEPVWSIGTGKIPKQKDIYKASSYLMAFLKNKFKTKKNPKILYGGSVNPKNVRNFKEINIIDGFLVGGASQDSKKFIDIVKKTFN